MHEWEVKESRLTATISHTPESPKHGASIIVRGPTSGDTETGSATSYTWFGTMLLYTNSLRVSGASKPCLKAVDSRLQKAPHAKSSNLH